MSPSIERVAMISLHTSPLDQPGTGDAGGMNVYVLELSKRLADVGVQVEMFTRATSSQTPAVVEVADGVRVHNVVAGPFEGLAKNELPSQLCTFAREVMRAEAAREPGYFDVVHSHYWLSGQVGALTRDRWAVPLVHTMHTMAKVKNEALAQGDSPEPAARTIGEEQVVAASDMLVANTDAEYKQLINLYDADPTRVEVVHPGVDLAEFRPVDKEAARIRLGLPITGKVVAFIGRIQPLKAPDIVLKAAAQLLQQRPDLNDHLTVAIIGGPSGTGLEKPELLSQLAHSLQISGSVRFVPPVSRSALVQWMAAADLVCVPSYNESFGLVAVEAQAVGTPVVAASVGGLPTAVAHNRSGLLIDGHEVADYANAFERVLLDDGLHQRLSAGAIEHAAEFGWDRTAKQTLGVYQRAAENLRTDLF
ncbi:MAG TPA: D-inositol-3-phosphate glycosyltransferase [Marmoricola sp.]|nr:D-inositol-3-phosphate glycosyltransferase [Marmoricola sp.]HNJ78764.1 D-inositol-3-phosphate glycosyltransferase [Marmoricola sp.]